MTPCYWQVSLELGGKNPAIVMKDADLGECLQLLFTKSPRINTELHLVIVTNS